MVPLQPWEGKSRAVGEVTVGRAVVRWQQAMAAPSGISLPHTSATSCCCCDGTPPPAADSAHYQSSGATRMAQSVIHPSSTLLQLKCALPLLVVALCSLGQQPSPGRPCPPHKSAQRTSRARPGPRPGAPAALPAAEQDNTTAAGRSRAGAGATSCRYSCAPTIAAAEACSSKHT